MTKVLFKLGASVFAACTFFASGGSSFQPGRRLLLQRLATALGAAERRGVDYEFALLHSNGRGAAEAALAAKRMAAMALELSRYGAAAQRVAVGLFPGAGEEKRGHRVRLVLRVNRAGRAAPKGAS